MAQSRANSRHSMLIFFIHSPLLIGVAGISAALIITIGSHIRFKRMDAYSHFLRNEAQHGEQPDEARKELYIRSEYAADGMDAIRAAIQEHERWDWHDTHECGGDKMVMDMSDCTTYTACTHCLERVWSHEANVKPLYFNRAA